MPTITVETNSDVYNIYFINGKMILTDSLCDYITSGYFKIVRHLLSENIRSFQKWDSEGNLLYNFESFEKKMLIAKM